MPPHRNTRTAKTQPPAPATSKPTLANSTKTPNKRKRDDTAAAPPPPSEPFTVSLIAKVGATDIEIGGEPSALEDIGVPRKKGKPISKDAEELIIDAKARVAELDAEAEAKSQATRKPIPQREKVTIGKAKVTAKLIEQKAVIEAKAETEAEVEAASKSKKGKRKTEDSKVKETTKATPKKGKAKTEESTVKTESIETGKGKEAGFDEKAEADAEATPRKGKRKTAEEKALEAMPLAARTVGNAMFVGAHVSAAGGVDKAVSNAVRIGANAFALFLKSQRKWENPPLKPEARTGFHAGCSSEGYQATAHVLPHGSYLVNLAQADTDKATQAYDAFMDDLQRCEALGIRLYNFHPGNTNGLPRSEAIARLAGQLNRAHRATSSVVTVLENMAGMPQGNTIGSSFADLRDIIALVDDPSRVGVCLDTCHAFAAGYDLRSPEAYAATMKKFDETVGLQFLRAWHMNDSKAPLGAHRDLHQNIGTGFLGLRAFHNVMNDVRLRGMPMVLETPIDKEVEGAGSEKAKKKVVEDHSVWAREIKLLESLVGMDVDGEEFLTLEKELADKGAAERARYQSAFETKVRKEAGKSPQKAKGKRKGRGKKESDVESDEDV